ncbi:hypothetical protein CRG98_037357, partial [Punica granatum]
MGWWTKLFKVEEENVEEDKEPDTPPKEEEDPVDTNVEDNDYKKAQLEEDEELAMAIQESLIFESPPDPPPAPAPAPASPPSRYDNGNLFQPYPILSSGY